MTQLITNILPIHGELRRPIGHSQLMQAQTELREYMRPRPVTRRDSPHLRCGICQMPFKAGERSVDVDDERCHKACAAEASA